MIRLMRRYRAFRDHTNTESISPIGFAEWSLGRIAGHLIATTAKMARDRGDFAAMNAALLAIWAGNRAGGGQPIYAAEPHLISRAIRENRLRMVIDKPIGD
ncbi:hypothetical protein [Arthrobacter sp. A2-55]|uniref:hypothetical protein n=1 Tax=Arthrobacter sp. A2-55 TaxID=2897337 RepID=UPI0021CD4CC5|nr:hypothetical protein [Arthrobacter sp. A2-55]MCU6479042.1 hypothetical protein [Arthrobacter sp. A2-55]